MRTSLEGLKVTTGESKVTGNCLEQKMHYLEREIAKLQSMGMAAG